MVNIGGALFMRLMDGVYQALSHLRGESVRFEIGGGGVGG